MLLLACLAVVGCGSMDLRGERFQEDELATTARQLRRADQHTRPFSFSNKARQIEEDLGCR